MNPMNAMRKAERPMLRYHGGKWMLAPWIVSHLPPHRIYVEPFGGAASVLLRKARSHSEVYNDLDAEIVNLFRVVRERGLELAALLETTPYAREEYAQSFIPSEDPMEQARRTVMRSYMGFGSNSLCRTVKSGFRSNSNRSGTTPARDWRNFPAALAAIIERLQGVVIEHGDACEIMGRHDSAKTLHYCDPPYVHATRTTWSAHGARKGYTHELDDDGHRRFAAAAHAVKGMVIVSGYHSELYDSLFSDWRVEARGALADGARKRTEVLWMNFESFQLL